MSEGMPKPKKESDKTLEEANERAALRQQHKSFFQRTFGRKESGMSMLQEEAERMNAQIDAEHAQSGEGSYTADMEKVSARSEFQSKDTETIALEEGVRAKSKEAYEALMNHEYADADRKEYLSRKDKKAPNQAEYNKFAELQRKQKESALSGGNLEATRAALRQWTPFEDINELLLIPEESLADPEIKTLVTKRVIDRLRSVATYDLLDKVQKLEAAKLVDETFKETTLVKMVSERMEEDLSKIYSAGSLRHMLDVYEKSRVLGDRAALLELPNIRERRDMLFFGNLRWVHDVSTLDALIKDCASLYGTEKEGIAILSQSPEVQNLRAELGGH